MRPPIFLGNPGASVLGVVAFWVTFYLIRHPSYAGSLLTILGVLVACANPVSLLGLIPALVAYGYRIHVEEQVLSRDLGAPYRAYMRRTRRLIPFLL
jgi:protein-S-isoprenylcysteine O-methyltransferase Ste14